jgi:hypothetical protein
MTDTTRENVERAAKECDGRICYASTNAEWPNRALQDAAALLLALVEERDAARQDAGGYLKQCVVAEADLATLKERWFSDADPEETEYADEFRKWKEGQR